MSAFDFAANTDEGATFTPITDGWGIGFKVSAPGRADRYVYLYPAQSDDLGQPTVFVYNDAHSPADDSPAATVCYVTVWDDQPTAPAAEDGYVSADADHAPVVTGSGDAFECGRCGLAVTADGRRHGHDDNPTPPAEAIARVIRAHLTPPV